MSREIIPWLSRLAERTGAADVPDPAVIDGYAFGASAAGRNHLAFADEAPDHPHGPAVSIFARRN